MRIAEFVTQRNAALHASGADAASLQVENKTMKKALGRIGILVCSAVLVGLPGVAQERGWAGNRNPQQSGHVGGSQGSLQRNAGSQQMQPQYSNPPRLQQQDRTAQGDRRWYSQNASKGAYATENDGARGVSAIGHEADRRRTDQEWRSERARHERRDFHQDRWDWR